LLYLVIFIVAFASIEILYFADMRKGFVASVLTAIAIVIGLCGYFYFWESSSYARDIQPLNLLFTNFLIAVVPISLYLFFVVKSRNFEGQLVTHVMAFSFAVVTAIAFPFFALIVGCYTGLDCI
jgi:hypothetical protein